MCRLVIPLHTAFMPHNAVFVMRGGAPAYICGGRTYTLCVGLKCGRREAVATVFVKSSCEPTGCRVPAALCWAFPAHWPSALRRTAAGASMCVPCWREPSVHTLAMLRCPCIATTEESSLIFHSLTVAVLKQYDNKRLYTYLVPTHSGLFQYTHTRLQPDGLMLNGQRHTTT